MDLPNVKMGMLFAFRSLRSEILSWRVCVWLNESDFAIIGRMLVSVERCRIIVMSTGFIPVMLVLEGGEGYGGGRRRLLGRRS